MPKFTEETTIRHAKYRCIGGRWFGSVGVGFVVMWKPTSFVVGFEVIDTGIILFFGPIAIGVGDPAQGATVKET